MLCHFFTCSYYIRHYNGMPRVDSPLDILNIVFLIPMNRSLFQTHNLWRLHVVVQYNCVCNFIYQLLFTEPTAIKKAKNCIFFPWSRKINKINAQKIKKIKNEIKNEIKKKPTTKKSRFLSCKFRIFWVYLNL